MPDLIEKQLINKRFDIMVLSSLNLVAANVEIKYWCEVMSTAVENKSCFCFYLEYII